jgi:predicted RNase H-like HicB family nuclease
MEASHAPVSAQRDAFSRADFLEWLDETNTPALVSFDHDRYYAFCVEFGVAGSGTSTDEAVRDATELLMKYLAVSFSEGRSYRESKKSPPKQIRLRSWYLVARTKLLRGVKPSLSRLGGLISVPMTDHDIYHLAR